MSRIEFSKFSGAGNDFIFINNMYEAYDTNFLKEITPKVCTRRFSIGADGLVILQPSDEADFKWLFYNADGSEAEMCGNAARCAARFAFLNDIAGKKMSFKTLAGLIHAEILENNIVKIEMPTPFDIKLHIKIPTNNIIYEGSFINTGVPHVVIKIDNKNFHTLDIKSIGKLIRYHEIFAPSGTNVDFYTLVDNHTVKMRTYERGVEDETLACGTGALAVASIAKEIDSVSYPVDVITSSSKILTISIVEGKFYLEGEARLIYNGYFDEEAYIY